MQIYWILFDEHPQVLQHLYDRQMRFYYTKLDIPEETDIIIRPATERILQHSEKINWDRETRLPAIHQRRVV